MADFDDLDRLLQLLRERPEQRAALRRLLADDDGAGEPGRSGEVSEALHHVDSRLEAIAGHLETLAEAQTRTEQHLEALTSRLDALAEAQTRTEQRLEALAEHTAKLSGQVGELRGDMVERRYRERAHAYLSTLARRVRLMPLEELDDLLDDAVDRHAISKEQADQVRVADAVVHGVRHGERVTIVVEASAVVDESDVERAHQRADILARAGTSALAVAAGERITEAAAEKAAALGVWQVVNGRTAEPPAQR